MNLIFFIALIRPLSYGNTDVFLLVFSVADRKSLEKIKTFWIPEIEREAPGTEMFIVGTKADLREERPNDDSIISTSEGKAFAANLGYVDRHVLDSCCVISHCSTL